MSILASNFVANSLQGTVTVIGGVANVFLPLSAFAFEGTKTFVVKLRKEGFTGTVIASSDTITIPDTTGIVSFTANVITAAEGNVILYTLTTSNVVNGTNVYYSTNSISAANVVVNDFVGSNIGMITIANNIGTVSLVTTADMTFDETDETFTVEIRTNNTNGKVVFTSSNVLLYDTSNIKVLPVISNNSEVLEGNAIAFTITIAANSLDIPLYYTTSGNATASNFTTANTGSITFASNSNTLIFTTVSNIPTSEIRNFNLQIRTESISGNVIATSNTVSILDTTYAYYSASGGNQTIYAADGYKYHVFNSSNNFTILHNTSSVNGSNLEMLMVGGGGGGRGGETQFPGNYWVGGGGGAGGVAPVSLSSTSLTTTDYAIVVGGGGTALTSVATPTSGSSGSNTIFSNTYVALGGGWGGSSQTPSSLNIPGGRGGSGGGAGSGSTGAPNDGLGANALQSNSFTGGYGNPGGESFGGPPTLKAFGGGGGGAGGAGSPGSPTAFFANGGSGIGIFSNWANITSTGISGYYAGGGGGGAREPAYIARGYGGIGGGGSITQAGNVNTGGGGGGAAGPGAPGTTTLAGGAGGSGIAIIKYPYFGAYVANAFAHTSTINEGEDVRFYLSVLNGNNFTLYYSTDGNVNTTNFIGGNTGSFTSNATSATITLSSNTNLTGTGVFTLQIRKDSPTGIVVLSAGNVTIVGTP